MRRDPKALRGAKRVRLVCASAVNLPASVQTIDARMTGLRCLVHLVSTQNQSALRSRTVSETNICPLPAPKSRACIPHSSGLEAPQNAPGDAWPEISWTQVLEPQGDGNELSKAQREEAHRYQVGFSSSSSDNAHRYQMGFSVGADQVVLFSVIGTGSDRADLFVVGTACLSCDMLSTSHPSLQVCVQPGSGFSSMKPCTRKPTHLLRCPTPSRNFNPETLHTKR
jgi:hypothetical protein